MEAIKKVIKISKQKVIDSGSELGLYAIRYKNLIDSKPVDELEQIQNLFDEIYEKFNQTSENPVNLVQKEKNRQYKDYLITKIKQSKNKSFKKSIGLKREISFRGLIFREVSNYDYCPNIDLFKKKFNGTVQRFGLKINDFSDKQIVRMFKLNHSRWR